MFKVMNTHSYNSHQKRISTNIMIGKKVEEDKEKIVVTRKPFQTVGECWYELNGAGYDNEEVSI